MITFHFVFESMDPHFLSISSRLRFSTSNYLILRLNSQVKKDQKNKEKSSWQKSQRAMLRLWIKIQSRKHSPAITCERFLRSRIRQSSECRETDLSSAPRLEGTVVDVQFETPSSGYLFWIRDFFNGSEMEEIESWSKSREERSTSAWRRERIRDQT